MILFNINQFFSTTFMGASYKSLIIGVVIIFFGFILKKTISKIVTKLLHSFYKKKEIEDSLMLLQKLVLVPLQKFIFYLFFFIGIYQFDVIFQRVVLLRRNNILTASGMVKEGTILTLQQLIEYSLLFLILYYLVLLISKFVDFLYLMAIEQAAQKMDKEKQQILPLMKDVSKVIIWFFGIFIILGLVFKMDIATIIAGLGIGGIALAFAAKDSLENLIASFMILVDKPFLIGDWIKVDAIEGRVEKVGFRSTRIRSFDRSLIIIPNKKLIDNKLENMSAIGVRRINAMVKIQYGWTKEEILKLQEAIQERVQAVPNTIGAPQVYLDKVDMGLMQLNVRYYIKIAQNIKSEKVQQEVNMILYELMNEYTKGFEYLNQSS